MADFKPNIYPIMYWGLLYGLVAGFGLLALLFLSRYIGVIWFPVFLIGLVFGGYRNYQRQKSGVGAGVAASPLQEFKNAAQDIASATREMINEQRIAASEEAAPPLTEEQELLPPEEPLPPAAPPQQPNVPPAPPR